MATGPANLAGVVVTYTQGGAAVSRPTRAGSYTVTASLSNAQYVATSVTGTLVIGRAIPIITWPSPAAIVSGAKLGSTQFDATASVPGSFDYDALLDDAESGTPSVLSLIFTPIDSLDYSAVTATAKVHVLAATATTLTVPVATATYKRPVTLTAAVSSSRGCPDRPGDLPRRHGGPGHLDARRRRAGDVDDVEPAARTDAITAEYAGQLHQDFETAQSLRSSKELATPTRLTSMATASPTSPSTARTRTRQVRLPDLTSSSGFSTSKEVIFDNHGTGFGNAKSIPVPADYFGEGQAAYAVWTPRAGPA